jgi:hypothetical protein
MRANAKGVLRPAAVAALFLAFAICALANNGRAFMAYYTINNVSEAGNNVHLTLQLKIFNYSGADIHQGAVALYNSELMAAPLGGFNAVKLFRAHHDVDLAQQFTIPKDEFRRWQSGANPALFFLYKNAKGQVLKSHIDLVRRPLPPAIQPGQ